jgi:hypothetical protein
VLHPRAQSDASAFVPTGSISGQHCAFERVSPQPVLVSEKRPKRDGELPVLIALVFPLRGSRVHGQSLQAETQQRVAEFNGSKVTLSRREGIADASGDEKGELQQASRQKTARRRSL